MNIPQKIRLELFQALLREKNVFGKLETDNSIIEFLSQIWNLESMPSQDIRFKNALGDIIQHTVNNDDWDYEYLFINRLELLKDDDKYKEFLELIVNPNCRPNESEIIKFILIIDSYINKFEYGLIVEEYNETGLPVYKITEKKEADDLPYDVPKNKIPFFVQTDVRRAYLKDGHIKPQEFPSFVLVFNDNWNDYGVQTSFYLFYYDETKTCHELEEVKIMFYERERITAKIPKKFMNLNSNFCSLGQSAEYYIKLQELLKHNFKSVLYALQDAAFVTETHEKFEKNDRFINSLIRYNQNERLLREAKYIIYDYDRSNLYSFKYIFKPNFSDDTVDIKFNFSERTKVNISNRIYAIIGKNGTGKTQFITSLPFDISLKKDESFTPKTPLFSKVIAVSYSAFDKFKIPKKTSSFNYTYCGLRDENGEQITERGLVLRFHNAWKEIERKERMIEWREILLNFIEESIIDEFIVIDRYEKRTPVFKVNVEGYHRIKDKLSSGQAIILYIITQIVSNIRFDTLLLFDEPETHLHPNAITQLMNSIYELAESFQSYCIITTHSPLIIRELVSKNVYVMEKNGAELSVNRIGIESFGENLTVLTDEVFGNKDIPKQYKKIIEKLVEEGNNFNEIVSALEFDNFPLSLNTRLYIKSVIKEGYEKF